MTADLQLLWCASCRTDREFERPPCLDGHGGDCPELACTTCGEAIFGTAALPIWTGRSTRFSPAASGAA